VAGKGTKRTSRRRKRTPTGTRKHRTTKGHRGTKRKPSKRKGGKPKQLTGRQWQQIRRRYQKGGETYAGLAREYGVTRNEIWRKAKAQGWSKRHQKEILRKAGKRAAEKAVEEMSEVIRRAYRDGIDLTELVGQLGFGAAQITAKRFQQGKGDASEFRAMASGVKDLMLLNRLLQGLSTSNPGGTFTTAREVEITQTFAQKVIRMRELRKQEGAPMALPDGAPKTINVAEWKRRKDDRVQRFLEAKARAMKKAEESDGKDNGR